MGSMGTVENVGPSTGLPERSRVPVSDTVGAPVPSTWAEKNLPITLKVTSTSPSPKRCAGSATEICGALVTVAGAWFPPHVAREHSATNVALIGRRLGPALVPVQAGALSGHSSGMMAF